ncbi:MAG: hypothetical protein HONBIEJF_02180 [Fimbriimonadaceae bacterium]|nr:hypothetical protein [Fimbriimonadaceae bacterium]
MTVDPFIGCCGFFLGWLVLSGLDAHFIAKSFKVLPKALVPRFLIANAVAMIVATYLTSSVPSEIPEYSMDPNLSGKYRMAASWCACFVALVIVKWPFVKAAGGDSVSWWRSLSISLPVQALNYAILFGSAYLIDLGNSQPQVDYQAKLTRASELPAAWVYFVDTDERALYRARFGDATGYCEKVADNIPTVGPEASSAIIWQPSIGYAVHIFSYNWTGSAWYHKLAVQPKPEQLEHFTDAFRQEIHVERLGNPAEYSSGIRSFFDQSGDQQGLWPVDSQFSAGLSVQPRFDKRYRVYRQSTYCPDHPSNITIMPNGFMFLTLGRRIYIVDLSLREISFWREGAAPSAVLDAPGIPANERNGKRDDSYRITYDNYQPGFLD